MTRSVRVKEQRLGKASEQPGTRANRGRSSYRASYATQGMEQGRGYAQRHRVQLEVRVFATIVEHDHGQVLLQLSVLAKIQQIFMRGGGQ